MGTQESSVSDHLDNKAAFDQRLDWQQDQQYTDDFLFCEFKDLTEKFCMLLKTVGVDQSPYRGNGPKFFQALDIKSREEILRYFQLYVDVCYEEIGINTTQVKESQLLWAMLRKLKFRPTSDIFGKIADDDIIEIYETSNYVQIYRSLRFFKVCSYSLDDILCRPWFHLYDRDSKITSQIFDKVYLAATPGNKVSIDYDLGPQELRELDSSENLKWLQEMRMVSPLFNSAKQISGVVNLVRPMQLL